VLSLIAALYMNLWSSLFSPLTLLDGSVLSLLTAFNVKLCSSLASHMTMIYDYSYCSLTACDEYTLNPWSMLLLLATFAYLKICPMLLSPLTEHWLGFTSLCIFDDYFIVDFCFTVLTTLGILNFNYIFDEVEYQKDKTGDLAFSVIKKLKMHSNLPFMHGCAGIIEYQDAPTVTCHNLKHSAVQLVDFLINLFANLQSLALLVPISSLAEEVSSVLSLFTTSYLKLCTSLFSSLTDQSLSVLSLLTTSYLKPCSPIQSFSQYFQYDCSIIALLMNFFVEINSILHSILSPLTKLLLVALLSVQAAFHSVVILSSLTSIYVLLSSSFEFSISVKSLCTTLQYESALNWMHCSSAEFILFSSSAEFSLIYKMLCSLAESFNLIYMMLCSSAESHLVTVMPLHSTLTYISDFIYSTPKMLSHLAAFSEFIINYVALYIDFAMIIPLNFHTCLS
jgi:hypothetical protein